MIASGAIAMSAMMERKEKKIKKMPRGRKGYRTAQYHSQELASA